MITSTYGLITCAMTILMSLVVIPYFFINIGCYWLLRSFYRQVISKRSLIYLQLITIPLLLLVFVMYVRYAHSFEGCILLLVLTYIVTHTMFFRAYYPTKRLVITFQMVSLSLVLTGALLAIYLIFIFNPVCSLIG